MPCLLGLQPGDVGTQMSKTEAMYGTKSIYNGPSLILGRFQELVIC